MSANLRPLPSARNLGVILDNRLSMAEQVTAICRACYYQLRQLRSDVQSLTSEASKSCIYKLSLFCNAMLYGTVDNQFQRLQSVQNATTRLVTGSQRSEHITLALCSMYWLPVRQWVTFKLATLVHKCLNTQAPTYLVWYGILEFNVPLPDVPGWLLSTDWRLLLCNEISGDLDTPRAAC